MIYGRGDRERKGKGRIAMSSSESDQMCWSMVSEYQKRDHSYSQSDSRAIRWRAKKAPYPNLYGDQKSFFRRSYVSQRVLQLERKTSDNKGQKVGKEHERDRSYPQRKQVQQQISSQNPQALFVSLRSFRGHFFVEACQKYRQKMLFSSLPLFSLYIKIKSRIVNISSFVRINPTL